jgi:threonylcarbamoyladenosine tRNA methylthiotransferase MtaB
MRVGFHTFGCKLNQFETEALASSLRSQGCSIVGAGEPADAYLINTCTVTTRADHKARAYIRALARREPDRPVIVTGCSAQLEARALADIAPNIVVVPQDHKGNLQDLPALLAEGDVKSALEGARAGGASDPFIFRVRSLSFHTRAFLKVQDGCDFSCAYCRVPLARGASVCLEADEAVRRAVDLEREGFREIVLTGVNISAYRSQGVDLAGLLSRILEITSEARLRLSSLEPQSVTESLAGALSSARVCPHFHLPVQSGSDLVLHGMRRRYTTAVVRRAVTLLRETRPDPFLAADLIVGYPGETEEEFLRTRDLVEELGLSALHVFPYSARPGTPAASLTPRVPDPARTRRARELVELSSRLSRAYRQRWVGRSAEALLERSASGTMLGVTENYLKVAVRGVPGGASTRGRIVRAVILDSGDPCDARFEGFAG